MVVHAGKLLNRKARRNFNGYPEMEYTTSLW
jgi:hypothetical protein